MEKKVNFYLGLFLLDNFLSIDRFTAIHSDHCTPVIDIWMKLLQQLLCCFLFAVSLILASYHSLKIKKEIK